MRTINSLAELRQERQRLYMHKAFLETEIKSDFHAIKEKFKPLNLLASKDNSVLSNSVGSVADLLIKNVVLKNSGFLARLVLPYLAKNITSNVVEGNKPQIASWIDGLISKFTHRKTEGAVL